MSESLSWIREAVGKGLLWAIVWAAVGALIASLVPRRSMEELWLGPAIGMFPGFLAGVTFSTVLAIAASRRRLEELSLPSVLACGGIAGLLVGMLPFVINKPTNEAELWLVAVVVIGSMTVLGAGSAAGSLALARRMKAARR